MPRTDPEAKRRYMRRYMREKWRRENYPVVIECPLIPEFEGKRFSRVEFAQANVDQWPEGTVIEDPRTGIKHTVELETRVVLRPGIDYAHASQRGNRLEESET